MSKRKRNIAYIKPDEPKFLRELKAQAGYKEGPTVDTKREELFADDDEDDEKIVNDEEPVVVVLKDGDLTAEQADAIKKLKDEEEANAKADLTKRIIFKNKNKITNVETNNDDKTTSKGEKRTKRTKKLTLSFNDEDDE